MSPTAVRTTGTASVVVDQGVALRLEVVNSKGTVVRTLLNAFEDAGTVTATWDRKDSQGRRVGKGTYVLRATATTTTTADVDNAAFTVS
jgi:flagellar hook assembly protein FlgD